MPGRDGVELVRQPKKVDPHLMRVLITGYAHASADHAAREQDGVYKLNKKTAQEFNDALKEIKGIKDELELLGCNITFQLVNNEWVKSVVGH